MAKKESTFLNMLITLIVVTSLASFTLASVYNLTKEPIVQAREAAKQRAISMVVPGYDNLETKLIKAFDGTDSLEFNLAYKNDELIGIAVASYTNSGFSGKIRAMVGLYPDGRIYDVVHLEHEETPGLGDKIDKSKSDWSDQFKDFDPTEKTLKVDKDGGDIDAITAATITSRAYCDAVNRAYMTFKENQDIVLELSLDDSHDNDENNDYLTQKEGE